VNRESSHRSAQLLINAVTREVGTGTKMSGSPNILRPLPNNPSSIRPVND